MGMYVYLQTQRGCQFFSTFYSHVSRMFTMGSVKDRPFLQEAFAHSEV